MRLIMIAAALSTGSAISLAPAPSFAQSAQSPFTQAPHYLSPQYDPFAYPQQLQPRQAALPEPRRRVRHAPPKHQIVHRTRAERPRKQARERPENVEAVATREGFKKVSDLVQFPKFFPGLGIIYVKPATLPLGPFLCFNRQRRLVATVYMVPIKDVDDHKTFDGTAPAFTHKVDHTTMYFNPGHPGVDMPHYHVVLGHVDKDGERLVAE